MLKGKEDKEETARCRKWRKGMLTFLPEGGEMSQRHSGEKMQVQFLKKE